jgi:tetratricopeptide (TPR) repeat protein
MLPANRGRNCAQLRICGSTCPHLLGICGCSSHWASGSNRAAALLAVSLILAPAWTAAEAVYTVVIHDSLSLAEAQQVLSLQSAEGWSASLRETNEEGTIHHQVCLGRFPTFAEAWVARESLAPSDYPTTSVASWEEPAPPPATNDLPLVLPFDTTGLDAETTTTVQVGSETKSAGSVTKSRVKTDAEAIQDLYRAEEIAPAGTIDAAILAKTPSEMSKDELWLVGRSAPSSTEGVPALERFLAQHPQDAKANAARLRLVRRLMARKDAGARIQSLLSEVTASGSANQRAIATYLGAYSAMNEQSPSTDPVEAFRAVASNPGMPREMRLDAMRRAAGLAHKHRDYPTAWLAFDQLEKTSSDQEVKAEARMQKAGLAFELADSAKGTWGEVRQLCETAAASPSATRQTRATAQLIRLETYFKEGDLQQALTDTNSFLGEYVDVRREWALASLWKGIFLVKLGRYEEATAALEPILSFNLTEKEKFAKVEPEAQAALWLAWMAARQEDNTRKQTYIDYLSQLFPESREFKAAQNLGLTPEVSMPTVP